MLAVQTQDLSSSGTPATHQGVNTEVKSSPWDAGLLFVQQKLHPGAPHPHALHSTGLQKVWAAHQGSSQHICLS